MSEKLKPCQPWLLSEVEQEVREERSARSRESAQRVREQKREAIKHLRGRDLQWLIDYLVDNGPATEMDLMYARKYDECLDRWKVTVDVWYLWRIGKLWRECQGIHPLMGARYYLYGIRGVHVKNTRAGEEGEPAVSESLTVKNPLFVTEPNPDCYCRECNPRLQRMILCPECGNKRCPQALNHKYQCTGSNEPNQVGISKTENTSGEEER